MSNKKPELLIPAGNLQVLKTAVTYGADAVYIGGDNFSLRAKAKNFDDETMAEAVKYAHDHGVKIHVTANISAHNRDIEDAKDYFKRLNEIGPDALIISDLGMFFLAKEYCPNCEIHISTQANSTNYVTFNQWHKLGASRVVAARELSLEELKDIRSKVDEDLEIEAFIHGAMCMSYSGRCLLSNYMVGRDANRGECTHPCRWKYNIVEENRPGEFMPVFENERGTYIFNSKDLCMIDKLPDLINAGVDSFKIEGRMKTALYVATVARAYRKAIDDYFEDENLYNDNLATYVKEIKGCTYRQFTRGFYYGKPSEEAQIYDSNTYEKGSTYIGTVKKIDDQGYIYFQQKNKFYVNDELGIMLPGREDLRVKVTGLEDEEGNPMESAPHPEQELRIKIDKPLDNIKEGLILRTLID